MSFLKQLSRKSAYSVYKDFQLNRWKRQSNKATNEYLKDHGTRKLHIGSGGAILDGWLNVDLEQVDKRVVYMDAGATYPFPENTFDFVFSEHVFEHLNLDQQLVMLAELRRTLKPGGKARLATPNLDALLAIRGNESPLVKDYINWSAEVFFPNKIAILGEAVKSEVFVINNYFYSWGHQFIHNPESFQAIARKMGFEKVRQVRVHESEEPMLQGLETHGQVITDRFNKMETMVFELEK
jgi:SAM-dependent methyltransferase